MPYPQWLDVPSACTRGSWFDFIPGKLIFSSLLSWKIRTALA